MITELGAVSVETRGSAIGPFTETVVPPFKLNPHCAVRD